jgi:hypothetical protein
MGKEYFTSPIGVFVYPWINKPDTKFASGGSGLYKVDLDLQGEAAASLRAKIDAAVDQAWELEIEQVPEGPARKKFETVWRKDYPYEIVEDDQGHPTGHIKFHFKQNATIKDKKSGEEKAVTIGIYDAENNPVHKAIFGGSEGRVRYAMRNYKFASGKTISVRLDFAMVQVTKMAMGSGSGGSAFDKVDGGYVEEDDGQQSGFPTSGEQRGSADGDY